MVQDDPKQSDVSGKVTQVVGGLIPGHKIISLLDGKLARWSNASCVSK